MENSWWDMEVISKERSPRGGLTGLVDRALTGIFRRFESHTSSTNFVYLDTGIRVCRAPEFSPGGSKLPIGEELYCTFGIRAIDGHVHLVSFAQFPFIKKELAWMSNVDGQFSLHVFRRIEDAFRHEHGAHFTHVITD